VGKTRFTFPGRRAFLLLWVGQLVSLLGSGLTAFALGVWIYQRTNSVLLLALNMLAYALPQVVLSPLAGALVDRWDRRVAMIVSDLGAGAATLAIAFMYLLNAMSLPGIYAATALMAAFATLQWPAWSAATTMLVPKEHLGRASGMVQLVDAVSSLGAPAIAGALYVIIGLGALVLMDVATYVFSAVVMIWFVRVPAPARKTTAGQQKPSLWEDMAFGWRYIVARPGLLGLLLFFAATNFFNNMTSPLLQPMILDTWSPEVLGLIGSMLGVGTLVGTIIMSVWGGPRRRILGLLGASVFSGLFLSLAGLKVSIALIAASGFAMMVLVPILNGCSQAIWQTKVEPELQGRVFSVRRMIAWSVSPLGILIAAPLADSYFKPLLVTGGPLAASVGRVMGVGPGRGIGLQIVVVGALMAIVALVTLLFPRVRNVEAEIPDAVGEPTPSD